MYERLKQVSGAVWNRPREKQIIEHEKICIDRRAQGLLPGRRGGCHYVLGEEFVGLNVQDSVPLQTGIVRHSLGDMAFSRPRFSDEDGVGAFRNELERVQFEACLFGDFWIEAPVKLLERQLLVEAGEGKPSLD